MTDYISREAAQIAYCELCGICRTPGKKECVEGCIQCMPKQNAIAAIPAADVVEVVRCGECIFRTSGYPSCQGRPNDWFCANGYGRNK